MKTRPLDTDSAAWSTYTRILGDMDGAARLYAAVELSETVREIRLAGIRARNPELAPREAVAHLVAEEFGVELPGAR